MYNQSDSAMKKPRFNNFNNYFINSLNEIDKMFIKHHIIFYLKCCMSATQLFRDPTHIFTSLCFWTLDCIAPFVWNTLLCLPHHSDLIQSVQLSLVSSLPETLPGALTRDQPLTLCILLSWFLELNIFSAISMLRMF